MGKIVAYLSHSYDPEDRAINMAIWRKLNALDVTFAVDPPSLDRPMDVTFLERMMWRSDCFVAIVPDRSRASEASAASHTWSPYQEFECRLAIRANKPRLIIVEKGIELGPLSEGQSTPWFIRTPLTLDPELDRQMKRLVDEAQARTEESVLPKMGILRWMPAEARWASFSEALLRRVGKDVARFIDVDDETDDHRLLNEARHHTVLVADVNATITPPHILGLLHGAAIPIFRTCLLEAGQTEEAQERQLRLADAASRAADENAPVPDANVPAAGVRLPLLFRNYRIDSGMRPIQFWTEATVDAAAATIARITRGYRDRERRLETQESGDDYFLQLRGNRIFISTSSELSEWTTPLKEALETAGMPAFHYKVAEIPVGSEWMPELRKRIVDADLFLAFLSPGYWLSPVCLDEMELAIERWEQHQLVIIVGTPASRPPMPRFLGRYQTEALSDPARDTRIIVKHVQDRFRRVGRSDAPAVNLIGGLLARHLEAESRDVQKLLESECGMPEAEAAEIHGRTGADPLKIVEALINRARTEKLGGSALGLLCYWLRRRESDPEMQRTLTRQFSLLRLFPKLHDIKSWNERRLRTHIDVTIRDDAPRLALEVITAISGDQAKALDAVKRMGEQIARYLNLADLTERSIDDTCRVTVDGSFDDLMIPVEWAVVENLGRPLGRALPLARRVYTTGARRESLEELFDDDAAAPPRVLLIGYGAPELPNVRNEIRDLRDQLTRRYAENGWPVELIESLVDADATAEAVQRALPESDFDIVHIAGHAGWVGGRPVIELSPMPGADRPTYASSSDLGQWLPRSSVRFLYLNCCVGAAMPLTGDQSAGWRTTLCREVLEAGVAEVASYFWPVRDQRAASFAEAFYAAFLKNFDAAGAMLAARRSTRLDDPTWAGSVLVKSARPKSSRG